MAEKMTPPKIIRREKFVVDHTETNDYGDLIVTSKLGNEYKVKQKRNQLFAIFQPDIEVVVGFASYMDREYIATATPSQQIISTDTPIEPETIKPPQEVAGKKPPEQRDKIGEGQREGMCWKEIGELIRTKAIVNVFGRENAMEITKQYRTYLLGTLKLTFDGAKLPQWKKENIEGG